MIDVISKHLNRFDINAQKKVRLESEKDLKRTFENFSESKFYIQQKKNIFVLFFILDFNFLLDENRISHTIFTPSFIRLVKIPLVGD